MSSSQPWKADLASGFLVFLIALPLCLGISMASGVPPTSGLVTAIVGGLLASFLGSARLTIKGPAAGLIVIALGAVTELGAGDPVAGYHRMLAVGVVAAVIQIVFALTKAGVVGDLMPSAVVHGMLAAIGVIIVSKQAHVLLGVVPEGKEPLHLLAEVPHSLLNLNPEVFLIGAVGLLILFGLPLLRAKWVRMVPAQMVVLVVAVPMALLFDLQHPHSYAVADHTYSIGPNFLIRLPASLLSAIALPDFSQVFSGTSLKYIVMFALVGTIESLLSVTAVDSLDPEKRTSDLNKDLLATGVANLVAASLGGLPMISEIVRSKANIDNGAKSHLSNFFHGAFLLASLALVPALLQMIPLTALAAMLIYTGLRLASPKEFMHVYHIGAEQLLIFVVTMLVTLTTDLLVGVGAGLVLKAALHVKNGAPLSRFFNAVVHEERDGDTVTLSVHDAAIFTNYLGLKRRIATLEPDVRRVVVDFDNAWVVDHTVLAKLDGLSRTWNDRTLELVGLDDHEASSHHPLAARRKDRRLVTA
ncbi:sulfate transporter [Luteitalea sp. TBR-22]|uniref:SulP family inorganic anion transporter n=1 Tax=Luteitalea sp. TBR-22 TaxID=2802971 RepID=UPI001AF4B9BB|nr:SulP family inorganic anion transporter [Luteitalea sp. TBR-22]BCS34861.1 sulfate transporter [Luteitalea sp. TBR-22]